MTFLQIKYNGAVQPVAWLQPPGCIAPRVCHHLKASTAVSIVFLSFGLGALECLCDRRGIIWLLGALFYR